MAFASITFFLAAFLVLSVRDPYGMEARAGLFVRAILHGKGLFCPVLYGHPYPDYPPFFFLIESIFCSYAPTISSLCLAMPSVLSGALLILVVFLSARRFIGEEEALVASAILFATPVFWLKAEKATLDVTLALFVFCANLSFFRGFCLCGPENSRFLFKGLGLLFLTGAYFVKGPVGLILSVAPCAIFLTAKRCFSKLFKFLMTVFATCVLVLLFHYMLLVHQGGEALALRVLDAQLLTRFGGEPNKPFYYYILFLIGSFIIWMPWLFPSGLKGAKESMRIWTGCLSIRDDFHFFTLLFAASCIAPFLFASSRHGRYLLPAFAPLALILACGIVRCIDLSDRKIFYIPAALFEKLPLLFSLFPFFLWAFDPLKSKVPIWLLICLLIPVWGLLFLVKKMCVSKALRRYLCYCLSIFLLTAGTTLVAEPGLSFKESGRAFVAATEAVKGVSPSGVYLFRLKPDGDGLKYSLYSRYYPGKIHFLRKGNELKKFPPRSIVVLYKRDLNLFLKRFPDTNYIIISEGFIHKKKVVSLLVASKAS